MFWISKLTIEYRLMVWYNVCNIIVQRGREKDDKKAYSNRKSTKEEP